MRDYFSKLGLSARPHKPPKSTPAVLPEPTTTGEHLGGCGSGTSNGQLELADRHHNTKILSPSISSATLDTLPAELRSDFLSCISELEDLKAVVHASPAFHQQYLLDREALLGKLLKTTLGNVLVDAYAVRTSASLYKPGRELPEQIVRQFMETYVAFRSAPDTILDRCSTEDLTGMACFYLSVARPLSLDCPALFCQGLDALLEAGSLSKTERIRFLRALYRFELCCNLFGAGNQPHPRPCDFAGVEMLRLFFCVFKPWEIEEIACEYVLIRDKYEQVFDDVRWDVHRDNPKFSDWGTDCSEGAFELEFDIFREGLSEGTISRGLRLFRDVLRTDTHQKLVKLKQENMIITARDSVEYALSLVTQDSRRREYPSDEDQAEAIRQKLPYSVDKEDRPPLAWVIMWKGTYSNKYGEFIPDSLKAWGYFFGMGSG